MPHEIPHLFFFIICERERGVGFECCVFECGEGLCWLAGVEDCCFVECVAWWSHLVGGVDGYEFFLDGLGEDLSDANVVVVDCFAAAFLAEQGECVFDVAAGELIERESTDLLVDLVDFGLVGFEDAWFDLCAHAVEPTLRVLFEGGMVSKARVPSAWSSSILRLSFSRASVLVAAIAVTKRRLPVFGLGSISRRICHLPLSSCQRVPVPFSRRGASIFFMIVGPFLA